MRLLRALNQNLFKKKPYLNDGVAFTIAVLSYRRDIK